MILTAPDGTQSDLTIRRLSICYNKAGKGHSKGIALADIGEYSVKVQAHREADCSCGESDCWHIEALLLLIAPHVLNALTECER